jgi:hypothetical protein
MFLFLIDRPKLAPKNKKPTCRFIGGGSAAISV